MRSLTRRSAGSIGIAMTLAFSVSTPMGAEEGSLCEALTLEDVSAIVDLSWELNYGNASGCGYREPESHPYIQDIQVQYQDGATLAELVAAEGARKVSVGEHHGVFLSEILFVQVGDELLVIQGSFTDPDVQSRIDLEGLLVDVARSTVDDLPERGGSDPGPPDGAGEGTIDAEAAGLPQLEGIEWHVEQDLQGQAVMDDFADADRVLWQAVLTMVGAEADEMRLINADVRSALSGDEIGRYSRVVLPGADEATLRAALEEQYRAPMGPDLVIEDIVVGGKDVSAWLVLDQPQAYVYYVGDTLHLFLGPEDILELILAELP